MGDKNRTAEIAATDTLVKTGHGILKAVYTPSVGDRTWVIRDGTDATGTVILTVLQGAAANGHFSAPYVNTPFATGLFVDNTAAGAAGTVLIIFE